MSLHSVSADPHVFVTPVLREASKFNRPQLEQIRKSFLPYTGSSQFEDDDLEEENEETSEEKVMTRNSAAHFSTAHFKPPPPEALVLGVSNHPFADQNDLILKPEDPISPLRGEELTLTVSNILINLRNSSSLQLSSPQDVISDKSSVDPLSIENGSPREYFGCFRAFRRFFSKEAVTGYCPMVEEPQWEWPPSEIHDLQYVGSGAQGSVYKATLRGRVIAVKKVSKQSETEIRHLRGLCHPNVVQFLGVSIDGPWYSILMEYCPNGNFFDILHSNMPVSIESIIDWTRQIAQGMNYLHSHKVVHRDLKSPNILIGENGQLKISDFGVSKEFTENSTKMSFAGTVAWMAPEIMRGEPCSFKVDVWSFGVIVWEILACEVPFNGVDCGAIIYGIASNRFTLPISTACPTEFRVLMKRCWCPKPRNRPSFPQILSQLDLACSELLQWRDEDFSNLRVLWQEEIHLQLMDLLKEGSRAPKLEISLMRQRRQELKDAQTIRQNYEEKLNRVNQLCSHLKALTEELEREQQKVTLERNRYRRLIYERSRSTTPFGAENFTKKSHPPVPPRSSRRSQSRDCRRREAEAKFTCKNCGTVNVSSHSADRAMVQTKVDAKTGRQVQSGHNPRWLRIWCAATKSKIMENASLMKTKLRKFASVGDIHDESDEKNPNTLCKSINVPTKDKIQEPVTMLSQARPLDSESEEQAADEKSCEISPCGEAAEKENSPPFNHISASCDDVHQRSQRQANVGRSSWSLRACKMDPEQWLVCLANAQNSPSLKDIRLSMFFAKQEEEHPQLGISEESRRSLSVSTSYSSESETAFNGSKATVIFQQLNSRPQSGDTCRTRLSKATFPSRGASSDRLQSRGSGLVEESDDLPPCLPSAAGPTLSVSHRSSPRLRQQPGRRLRRTPQSPLPTILPPPSPTTESGVMPALSSSVTTSLSPALGVSLNSSSPSTSPSLTTSQMRRSIEKLTMELTDHIADSLSEKERRVDVIERQLLWAASDRKRCLPVHSIALVVHDAQADNKEGDASVDCDGERPWLSAADLNCKVNGVSMDASSILDTESIPTDSETDVQ
ncbi:hypothetical protein Aperf_G00000107131 [Anoplocephala perfoliata]